MIAVILAAGRGTRLEPYTNKKPKCLIEFNGNSIIEKQISILKQNKKIKKIVIVTGYRSNQLNFRKIIKIRNKNYKTTNMLFSFFLSKEYFNNDIILSYADILYSSNLLNKLVNSQNNISVAIDKNWKTYWKKRFRNYYNDIESLYLDNKEYISEIGNKKLIKSKIKGQYIGLVKFRKKPLQSIKKKLSYMFNKKNFSINKNKYITDLLQDLIHDKYKIKSIPFYDDWIEIDSVKDIESNYNKERYKRIF